MSFRPKSAWRSSRGGTLPASFPAATLHRTPTDDPNRNPNQPNFHSCGFDLARRAAEVKARVGTRARMGDERGTDYDMADSLGLDLVS